MKERYVDCNRAPFMNKEIRKTIMKRTRLLNKSGKDRSNKNLTGSKTARCLCETPQNSKKTFTITLM